jgi:Secretion system C-terminal sorting domain
MSDSIFMTPAPLSIAEDQLSGILEVYPNPNQGAFTLKLPEDLKESSTLNLYSVAGTFIESINLNNMDNTNKIKISTKLTKGAYWLILNTPKSRYVNRLIIN